jgi:hypothetical protein
MNAPIENDRSFDLNQLWFEELGRSIIVGRESDRELFADLPHVLSGPHFAAEPHGDQRGERFSGTREFLSADFRAEI